jgi:RNA-directed DNA polymerase
MPQTKSQPVSKRLVWEAYKRVKANKGAAGLDGQSLVDYEQELSKNLYKLWNRMASGSYMPPAVKQVEIPKKDGGKRALGIPTVSDRIAQMVVKLMLEPQLEPVFHNDSYGYRPKRSAHDALAVARKRCWRRDWVIDLDIKGFFDNLDHQLMMKAVGFHTDKKWVQLYVERWLTAPIVKVNGEQESRFRGTPQGGVISPLLANLFMHYAFDNWLARNHPHIQFERYADDALVHCRSRQEAEVLLGELRVRLAECGLELHPVKTKIVYCKDDDRRGTHEHISFDFLGYGFRPRRAKNRYGKYFVSFLPAISKASAQSIRDKVRSWEIPSKRNNQTLEQIAELINPTVRGWIHYYGKFYRSEAIKAIRYLERVLMKWACRKFKKLARHQRKAIHWMGRVARRESRLMAHWQIGLVPAIG